jgi:hypothetical protein
VKDPLAHLPSPPPGAALRVLVSWVLDHLAAALAARLKAAEAHERDPDWGMVSQKTLPAWIHVDAYVDACRSGKVDGARLWRRHWIAPRDAVERWWLAESREPSANDGADEDPESFEAMLRLNGLDPKDAPAAAQPARRRGA